MAQLVVLASAGEPLSCEKVSPKVGDFNRGQDRRWVTRLWLHSQDKRHPLAKVDNTQWASLEHIVFFLAVFQPRDQRKMESKRRDVYVSSLYFWLHSIPCQNWSACLMCQSPQNWNWKNQESVVRKQTWKRRRGNWSMDDKDKDLGIEVRWQTWDREIEKSKSCPVIEQWRHWKE